MFFAISLLTPHSNVHFARSGRCSYPRSVRQGGASLEIQKAMVEEWSENCLICAAHFGHCDGGPIYDGMSGIKIRTYSQKVGDLASIDIGRIGQLVFTIALLLRLPIKKCIIRS